MVVVMEQHATEKQIETVNQKLEKLGFKVHRSTGVKYTILGAIGDKKGVDPRELEVMDGVLEVVEISKPYKLASREFNPEGTVVKLKGGLEVGGDEVILMAGPCAVESEEQVLTIAKLVSQEGAKVLRGGAFKPRTSPYSFQGLGEPGLKILQKAAQKYGMLTITEVMHPSQVELVACYADILQVGQIEKVKAVGVHHKGLNQDRGVPLLTIHLHLQQFQLIQVG